MAYTYSAGPYGAGLYSAEETVENTKITSWSFSIDGHQFVFIQLGVQGTYVLDTGTGQWHNWSQMDIVGLGFRDGQVFDEFYLMGSQTDGTIYTFDPEELDDYSGGFSAVVTVGLQAKARETTQCFGLYVSGERSDKTDREISLYVSDDNGKTWSFISTLPVDDDTEIAWRSLGVIRKPGRLFEIKDDGSLKSIDGFQMAVKNGS